MTFQGDPDGVRLLLETEGRRTAYGTQPDVDLGATLGMGAKLAEGKVGQALAFDGKGDVVLLPTLRDALIRDLKSLSIACWVQTTKPGIIFDVGGDWNRVSLANRGLAIGMAPRGALLEAPLGDGWHHLAGVWDGDHQTSYVDGRRAATTETQSHVLDWRTVNKEVARIGQQAKEHHRSGRAFGGLVDELLIHEDALSDEQIMALFQRGQEGRSLMRTTSSPVPRLKTKPAM